MKTVYLLTIDKKATLNGNEYKNFLHEVGHSAQSLIDHLTTKYGFTESELIKNISDDFPYFTDGGFKYKATNSDWEYTFTCYPTKLL